MAKSTTCISALEFVEGTDLQHYINRHGPLPVGEARRHPPAGGGALAHLHSQRRRYTAMSSRRICSSPGKRSSRRQTDHLGLALESTTPTAA